MTDKHPCPLCGREMVQYGEDRPDGGSSRYYLCPRDPDQHEIAALKKERDELKRELEEAKQGQRNIYSHFEREERDRKDAQARVKELEMDKIKIRDVIAAAVQEGHCDKDWVSTIFSDEELSDTCTLLEAHQTSAAKWREFETLASERGAQVVALRKLGRHLDFVIDNTPPHKSRAVEIRAAQMAWRAALTSTADAAEQVRREILEGAESRVLEGGWYVEHSDHGRITEWVNFPALQAKIKGEPYGTP